MQIAILLIAGFILLIAHLAVNLSLITYRTDIRPGEGPFAGRSRFAGLWPRNYRPGGRRLLYVSYGLQVLLFGVMLALLAQFVR